MTEYDLLLKNLAEMCKLAIEIINKSESLVSGCNFIENGPEIITPLNDAYKQIILTTKCVNEFKSVFLQDDIFKLIHHQYWINIKDERTCFIQYIDLHSMVVGYSCKCGFTPFNDEIKITKFLNDFKPL